MTIGQFQECIQTAAGGPLITEQLTTIVMSLTGQKTVTLSSKCLTMGILMLLIVENCANNCKRFDTMAEELTENIVQF